jgi:hypothetical protein
MVIAETGIALILLTSAGLLVRSFQELATRDTGLPIDELATLRVDVRRIMEEDEAQLFFEAIETRVEGLPGVGGAPWITTLPFTTDGVMSRVTLERSTGELDVEDFLPTTSVSPSFFQTAGLRILHGRGLGRDDCAEAPTVAVVNEAFVQQYWPDEPSVLGLQFWYGDRGDGDPVEVVGVVEDMAYRLNSDPLPQLLVAMAQSFWGHATLVVRTAGEPVAMLGIALGVAASLLTTGFIPEYLFQVEPTDALTFASTAGLLLVASLLAAWIPARRVARVDPQLSLSSEA